MKQPTFTARPTQKHSKRRLFLLIGLVLALFLITAGGYAYWRSSKDNTNSDRPTDASNQTDTNKNSGEDNPDNSSFKEDAAPADPHDHDHDADITLPPDNKPALQIESFSQPNNRVVVAVKTLQVGGSGTCLFSFTNPDDRPVVQEVASNGNGCTANLPRVEFAKNGIWALNISYLKGQTKVVETNQNVTIN